MPPTISFLVPTHREDRPLKRCLDSIVDQLGVSDEVIVIGDTHDGRMPAVERLVESYDHRFRYLSLDAGRHSWGHDQLNLGLESARGTWIHCNDDDDVWAPGAVKIMREMANVSVDHPILFRFLSYHGLVFWAQRGLFAYERVGGHCLLTPNIPGKVGRWEPHYQGDWSYVSSTVALLGGEERIVWDDRIVVVARPPGPVLP